MSNAKDTTGVCPVTQCLDTATTAAKSELGTDGGNKRVKATASLTVAVTEDGTTKTDAVDATVELGVSSKEEPAA